MIKYSLLRICFSLTVNIDRHMIEDKEVTSSPNRIIIESTNRCNLDCTVCLRQSWNEDLGSMSKQVFSKLVADLRELPSPPDVIFGGYGEPLSHTKILDMIRRLTDIGCRTALITNGTLLTTDKARSLREAGLGKLWISADSIHQQALVSAFEGLHSSTLTHLKDILRSRNGKLEEMNPGLVMVLTAENQTEILDDVDQARKLGIRSFFITNLEAYTPAQVGALPYTLRQLRQPGSWRNASDGLIGKIKEITANDPEISIDGVLTHHRDRCPFAERGDLVLRWDGEVSPCVPLLYDHTIHLGSWEHKQYSCSLGNLLFRSVKEIWIDAAITDLRERLLEKEFSPCLSCRDCWFSDNNRQDCQGFEHPTCGGCLWAEGLIDCP